MVLPEVFGIMFETKQAARSKHMMSFWRQAKKKVNPKGVRASQMSVRIVYGFIILGNIRIPRESIKNATSNFGYQNLVRSSWQSKMPSFRVNQYIR